MTRHPQWVAGWNQKFTLVNVRSFSTLRGQEGARIKRSYQLAAQRFGIPWNGRLYDRANPDASDTPNQALNHAATAMSAAATVAVASLAAIPQLGFIHEDSGQAFVLDIADLYRHDVTLEIAFGASQESLKSKEPFERLVRRRAAKLLRQRAVIPSMIDKIKTLLHLDADPPPEKEPPA